MASNSRPTNTGDTALWLHNKLGTSNDATLWADNTSIISQLNPEVLRNIKACFHDLQVNVKLKLLLTFLHISRRNLEEWRKELESIIGQALKDSEPWVSVLAEMLRTFPNTGMVNFEFKTNPNQTFLEFFNEIKKLIKKNETKKGFTSVLPLESLFLDRRVYESAYGQTKPPAKHFQLKHETKASTQRAEYLQKACEASQNKKTSTSLMVQRRHRIDSGPLRGIPRSSMFNSSLNRSTSFGRSMSSGSSGVGSRLFSTVNAGGGKRDGGIVLLDVNELPSTNRETLKKRKKEEKEEKEKEKEREKEEKEKEKEREKAAKAPTTPTTPVFGHKTSKETSIEMEVTSTPSTLLTPTKSGNASNLELPGSLSQVLQQTSMGAFQRASPQQQSVIMASKSVPATATTNSPNRWPPPAQSTIVSNNASPFTATTVSGPIRQPFSILRQTIAATTSPQKRMPPKSQPQSQDSPFEFNSMNEDGQASSLRSAQLPFQQGMLPTLQQQQQQPQPLQNIQLRPRGSFVYVRNPFPQQQPSQGQGNAQPIRQNFAFLLPPQQQQQQQQQQLPDSSFRPQMLQQQQQQMITPQAQNGQMIQQQQQQPQQSRPQRPASQPAAVQIQMLNALPAETKQIAQNILQTSPCLSRPEKALILAFISGQRDNPCPQLGPISTIKLSEKIEDRHQLNGVSVKMLVEAHFKMNFETGQWTKVEKVRPADEMAIKQVNSQKNEDLNTIRIHRVENDVSYLREMPFGLTQPQQQQQQFVPQQLQQQPQSFVRAPQQQTIMPQQQRPARMQQSVAMPRLQTSADGRPILLNQTAFDPNAQMQVRQVFLMAQGDRGGVGTARPILFRPAGNNQAQIGGQMIGNQMTVQQQQQQQQAQQQQNGQFTHLQQRV